MTVICDSHELLTQRYSQPAGSGYVVLSQDRHRIETPLHDGNMFLHCKIVELDMVFVNHLQAPEFIGY